MDQPTHRPPGAATEDTPTPRVLSFADLGPEGEQVATYMTWGLAAAIDDDTARAALTIPDQYRVQWALEDGGMLEKAKAFIRQQAPPPWESIPKPRQLAEFLTLRALADWAPEKFAVRYRRRSGRRPSDVSL